MAVNVPTQVLNTLARFGLTLADTENMTDEQLLSMPNFGKTSLKWTRQQTDGAKSSPHSCPHCGRLLNIEVTV